MYPVCPEAERQDTDQEEQAIVHDGLGRLGAGGVLHQGMHIFVCRVFDQFLG